MLIANIVNPNSSDISIDHDISAIRDYVADGGTVIIRGVLTKEEAMMVRERCIKMRDSSEPSNPEVTNTTPNFHRIDDNPPKSRVKRIMRVYKLFYWNQLDTDVLEFFKRCAVLRNMISGLPHYYAMDAISDDGFVASPVVQQYPRGGGFMETHVDPDVGQKAVMSVCLSEQGKDFLEGGLFVQENDGLKRYVDNDLMPGDALVFYPKHVHGVDPIDSKDTLDWHGDDGRWMMMSTLVTQSSLNQNR